MTRRAAILSIMAVSLTAGSSIAQDRCDTSTNRGNCVLYARCRVPRLPFGLTTYQDKARIINSRTPGVGSVAIMNVGAWGHVAVVEAVNHNGTITVREANYPSPGVRTRTATPSAMKVTGYYRP